MQSNGTPRPAVQVPHIMPDDPWAMARDHLIAGDQAHAKGDEHYKAAGLLLHALKAEHDAAGGTWAEWDAKTKEKLVARFNQFERI
jgi:hypothetical protein